MGLFRSKKRKKGKARVEPRLFSGRDKPATADRPRRRRRSLFGWLFRFAFTAALFGTGPGFLGRVLATAPEATAHRLLTRAVLT